MPSRGQMVPQEDKGANAYGGNGKRTRNITIAVVALLVVAGAAGYFYLQSRKPSADSLYRTATASNRHLVATVSADGQVTPVHSTDVYPGTSGTVKRLYVSLGDTVKAGARLYTVDASSLHGTTLQAKGTLASQRQAKRQASAALESARQALAQARAADLQATQNLSALESKPAATPGRSTQIALAKKQKTASHKGVLAAEASVDAAASGVSAASTNVSSAQYTYDQAADKEGDAVVTAPVSGVITTMNLAVGSLVSGGTGGVSAGGGADAGAAGSSGASIVISDTGEYKVRVDLAENQRPHVKLGQQAHVSFAALKGGDTSGTVTWIAPAGTNTSGVITYAVDVSLATQPTDVAQGMSATAKIVTSELADALTIPTAAVKVDGATTYAVLLGANGKTRAATIKIGKTDNANTQVLSGIAQGDVVVLGVKSNAGAIVLPTPTASSN